jgi:hypothetical protein
VLLTMLISDLSSYLVKRRVLYTFIGLSTRRRDVWLSGDNGKHPVVVGQLSWNWAYEVAHGPS